MFIILRMAAVATILNVYRGDKNGGKGVDYKVPIAPGMVVLDALH